MIDKFVMHFGFTRQENNSFLLQPSVILSRVYNTDIYKSEYDSFQCMSDMMSFYDIVLSYSTTHCTKLSLCFAL